MMYIFAVLCPPLAALMSGRIFMFLIMLGLLFLHLYTFPVTVLLGIYAARAYYQEQAEERALNEKMINEIRKRKRKVNNLKG